MKVTKWIVINKTINEGSYKTDTYHVLKGMSSVTLATEPFSLTANLKKTKIEKEVEDVSSKRKRNTVEEE
ncbi:MAG: hypothetical protein J6Y78_09775 [Paludibacteraceae bacterium]|nr:hypothetical protein [Paludibacteraceae bacterium]